MYNWFECKISIDKIDEEGIISKKNEVYLVDALSFTEAEERITTEMKPFISGDFLIANIKRAKIAELYFSNNSEADKWYRCKINYISVDENKGVEKRIAQNIYVQAENFKNAVDSLIEHMQGSLGDYEIASIAETAVMDVYPYEVVNKVEKTQNE